MLPLLILVPLAVLIMVNLPVFQVLRRAAWGLLVLMALVQVAVAVLAPITSWIEVSRLEEIFSFHLASDNLSRVLLLSTGLVLFATVLVGRGMITDERRQFNFMNLLLISLIGMNGIVLVTDLFSLYVFLEVVSVSSFVLIAFNREKNALEGAFKYIVLSAVATILMLGSVALFMMLAGGVSFADVHQLSTTPATKSLAIIAVGAFVCGLFIKGGLVPFHGWLPDAYSSAPAPVSVLLAGIVTKASGIYALIRLASPMVEQGVFSSIIQLNGVLLAVGAVSIIVGALAALKQTDLKRMLAYSSISQIGYIVLAVGCGTPLALAGAVFHLFNHAIFKTSLFVNSAALEQRLGTTDMNRMSGLGSRMPVTGFTSVLATLSVAGIPPLSGFWSKLIIIIALWTAGFHVYAGIAVLFSVVTLAYLLLIQRRIFFGKVSAEFAQVREAGFGLVLPAIILTLVTLGVGLAIPYLFNSFLLPIASFR